MAEKKDKAFVRKLLLIVCSVSIIALTFAYIFIKPVSFKDGINDVLSNVIPNLIAALISVCTIITVFTLSEFSLDEFLNGESPSGESGNSVEMQKNIENILRLIAAGKTEIEAIRENQSRVTHTNLDIDSTMVYSNYRHVEWEKLLRNSKTLDIAVVYYDSWIKSNWETLITFFKNDGHLRIILPNPSNATNISDMLKYFPKMENDSDSLITRINLTQSFIKDAYNSSVQKHGKHGSYEIHFIENSINYPLVIVDHKVAVVSVFEHFSDMRVNAPSVVIPYGNDAVLNAYWNKEITLLIKASKLQLI